MEHLKKLAITGQFDQIEQQIRQTLSEGASPEERSRIADMAMRIHRFELALEVLHPIVFPEHSKAPAGSEEQRVIYILALTGLGSTRAAHALLDTLAFEKYPIALRIRGTLYRKTWAFERALPWLEKAENQAAPGSIEWLVSRKERLLALLLSDGPSALWDQLYAEIPDTYLLPEPLIFECRFIAALADIMRTRHTDARSKLLLLQKEILPGTFGSIGLLIENLCCSLPDQNNQSPHPTELKLPKTQDPRLTHPDYFRIAEYILAKQGNDHQRLLQLYVGSPYFGLKKKLLPILLENGPLPDLFEWPSRQNPSGIEPLWTHDLRTGDFRGISAAIAPGTLNSRILRSLLSDLYRPRHLLEFHSEVYPREIFSPTSSPLKIHQALFRLRTWCKKQGIGLSARIEEGLVILDLPENASFHLPIETPYIDSNQGVLGAFAVAAAPTQLGFDLISLGRHVGDAPFSAAEVESHFGVSRRTANRFIKDLLEAQWLIRSAKGKNTTYKWSEPALKLIGLG